MNKAEVIDSVMEKTGWTKREAEEAVRAFLDTVTDAVAAGEKVTLPGFGTFEKRERAARTARNPQTGDPIIITERRVLNFKASQILKHALNPRVSDAASAAEE